MRVGLYSENARRAIIAGRVLIARRGYPATAFLGMYIFHVGARA